MCPGCTGGQVGTTVYFHVEVGALLLCFMVFSLLAGPQWFNLVRFLICWHCIVFWVKKEGL